ncbi:glycosyltransferase family 4 protein [Photobacterium kagoshimensis]|uniref:glycosyltransferase family 4 protein n=1 Tax=Photobacterium kagoshimensis TaxID=2910242 RepID=UPI003D10A8CC
MINKICFALNNASGRGGIERVSVTLSNKLKSLHNFDVSILSLYKTYDEEVFKSEGVKVEYLNHSHEVSMYNRKLNAFKGIIFDLNYIRKKAPGFRRYIRDNKIDTIICSDIKMVILALFSTVGIKTKVIAIEHFEYDVPHPILKWVRSKIYNKIDALVILTNEDRHLYHWMDSDKLFTIPNIVEAKTMQKNTRKKVAIAVGRLCEQKGFDLLIDAWHRSTALKAGWKLEIYGEGEDKDYLNKIIEDNRIENITLMPYAKNIDSVYNSAEMFILSSRYEGLGMVLIEALAHSLPCISFDCPAGPKTIITHEENGLLVPVGDVAKLAKAIDLLINTDELRSKFINNASNSIDAYSENSVTEKWMNLFRLID